MSMTHRSSADEQPEDETTQCDSTPLRASDFGGPCQCLCRPASGGWLRGVAVSVVGSMGAQLQQSNMDFTQMSHAELQHMEPWLISLFARLTTKTEGGSVTNVLNTQTEMAKHILSIAELRGKVQRERNRQIVQKYRDMVIPQVMDRSFLNDVHNMAACCTENYCCQCDIVAPPQWQALEAAGKAEAGKTVAGAAKSGQCDHCNHLLCFMCSKARRKRLLFKYHLILTLFYSRLIFIVCNALCCPPIPNLTVRRLVFISLKRTYQFVHVDRGSGKRKVLKSAKHVRPPFATYSCVQVRRKWLPLVLQRIALRDNDRRKWFDIKVWRASFVQTSRGNRLPYAVIMPENSVYNDERPAPTCGSSVFAKQTDANRHGYVLIFSHPNGMDMGHCVVDNRVLRPWVKHIGCPIVVYDYSGYGMSTGRSSEENLYADIAAVFDETLRVFNITADKVVLFGFSLGTAVSIDLAAKTPNIAGLVLIGAFSSAVRTQIAIPPSHNLCFDMFDSFEKMHKVSAPTLFIHGTADKLTPLSRLEPMVAKAPNLVELYKIDGCSHEDVFSSLATRTRVVLFLFCDLFNANRTPPKTELTSLTVTPAT